MKIDKGHLHALSLYSDISYLHYFYIFVSLFYAKVRNCKTVTTHLPLELQHPKYFKNYNLAKNLILFAEFWKKVIGIKLYWENAPLLTYGSWKLKYGQTEWNLIPTDLELCLDSGHLILGSKNTKEARNRIMNILKKKGDQIKHLHISENNFISDEHKKPGKVLYEPLLKLMKKGRTFIYEK